MRLPRSPPTDRLTRKEAMILKVLVEREGSIGYRFVAAGEETAS
jgi:hypothetical protein